MNTNELDSQMIEDLNNECFRLRSEKLQLRDENQQLVFEKFDVEKEKDAVKKILKLNSLILILMSELVNLSDKVDFGIGIKRAVGKYQSIIVQVVEDLPGHYSSACNVDDDDDD